MDTAREAPVGYDSGDVSAVVGSAVNRQTDAATYARVDGGAQRRSATSSTFVCRMIPRISVSETLFKVHTADHSVGLCAALCLTEILSVDHGICLIRVWLSRY